MAQQKLTPEETEWAYTIKDAIRDPGEQELELDPISDFEIAQWAMMTLGMPLAEVLHRIYQLQCFRNQYKLGVNLEEGMELVRTHFEQHPGTILAVDCLPPIEHYLFVYDFAAFDPSRIRSETDWKVLMGGFYYLFLAMTSTLTSVRAGIVMILECEGMGFHNLDMRVEERWLVEFGSYYPHRLREMTFVNAPTAATMMVSLIKPIFPEAFFHVIKLGGSLEGYEGQRLDALYNMPTPAFAKELSLRKIQWSLEQRLSNERTYSLPPRPVQGSMSDS